MKGGLTDPSAPDDVSHESVSDATVCSLHDELVRLGHRREIANPSMILHSSAYKILWLLVEHGPHTLRELAQGLQLDQSTITRQVNTVIGRGLAQLCEQAGSNVVVELDLVGPTLRGTCRVG